MAAAEQSRRPEYARAIFVAATTGLRRGELCALRRKRDIDWDRRVAIIAWNLIDLNGRPVSEIRPRTVESAGSPSMTGPSRSCASRPR